MCKDKFFNTTDKFRHCYGFFDLFVVIFMGWLSYALYFSSWNIEEERYSWAILIGALLAVILFPLFGMYDSWRGQNIGALFYKVVMGYLCWGGAVIFVIFMFKLGIRYSRGWLFSWWGTSLVCSLSFRMGAYYLYRKFFSKPKYSVILIGDNNYCKMVDNALTSDKNSEFYISKIFCGNSEDLLNNVVSEKWLLSNSGGGENEVWICLPLSRGKEVISIAKLFNKTSLNIRFMPGMEELRLINHKISSFSGVRLLDISCSPMTTGKRLLKRMEDIIIASIILIFILPVMVFIGIGVKLSSKGPIFYRQTRVSWNNKIFNMLKFRSMPVDIEKNSVEWGNAKNKEITDFGKFIRKTSLDELPQFLNVLKGDMSIVGPRPERDIFVKKLGQEIPGYMQKHMVKAGITGWAQIHGLRGDTSLEKRIEYDLWYIENWSLWLDIKIIFLTLFRIFADKNAI